MEGVALIALNCLSTSFCQENQLNHSVDQESESSIQVHISDNNPPRESIVVVDNKHNGPRRKRRRNMKRRRKHARMVKVIALKGKHDAPMEGKPVKIVEIPSQSMKKYEIKEKEAKKLFRSTLKPFSRSLVSNTDEVTTAAPVKQVYRGTEHEHHMNHDEYFSLMPLLSWESKKMGKTTKHLDEGRSQASSPKYKLKPHARVTKPSYIRKEASIKPRKYLEKIIMKPVEKPKAMVVKPAPEILRNNGLYVEHRMIDSPKTMLENFNPVTDEFEDSKARREWAKKMIHKETPVSPSPNRMEDMDIPAFTLKKKPAVEITGAYKPFSTAMPPTEAVPVDQSFLPPTSPEPLPSSPSLPEPQSLRQLQDQPLHRMKLSDGPNPMQGPRDRHRFTDASYQKDSKHSRGEIMREGMKSLRDEIAGELDSMGLLGQRKIKLRMASREQNDAMRGNDFPPRIPPSSPIERLKQFLTSPSPKHFTNKVTGLAPEAQRGIPKEIAKMMIPPTKNPEASKNPTIIRIIRPKHYKKKKVYKEKQPINVDNSERLVKKFVHPESIAPKNKVQVSQYEVSSPTPTLVVMAEPMHLKQKQKSRIINRVPKKGRKGLRKRKRTKNYSSKHFEPSKNKEDIEKFISNNKHKAMSEFGDPREPVYLLVDTDDFPKAFKVPKTSKKREKPIFEGKLRYLNESQYLSKEHRMMDHIKYHKDHPLKIPNPDFVTKARNYKLRNLYKGNYMEDYAPNADIYPTPPKKSYKANEAIAKKHRNIEPKIIEDFEDQRESVKMYHPPPSRRVRTRRPDIIPVSVSALKSDLVPTPPPHPFLDRLPTPQHPYIEKLPTPQRPYLEKPPASQRPYREKLPNPQRLILEKPSAPQRPYLDKQPAPQHPYLENPPVTQRPYLEKQPAPQRPYLEDPRIPQRPYLSRSHDSQRPPTERKPAPLYFERPSSTPARYHPNLIPVTVRPRFFPDYHSVFAIPEEREKHSLVYQGRNPRLLEEALLYDEFPFYQGDLPPPNEFDGSYNVADKPRRLSRPDEPAFRRPFDGSYNEADEVPFPGDYPKLNAIPETGFTCADKVAGYYADPKTGCQVFHICEVGGRMSSFLCANGTLFNQALLVCDWWHSVECQTSPNYYNKNLELFIEPNDHVTPLPPKEILARSFEQPPPPPQSYTSRPPILEDYIERPAPIDYEDDEPRVYTRARNYDFKYQVNPLTYAEEYLPRRVVRYRDIHDRSPSTLIDDRVLHPDFVRGVFEPLIDKIKTVSKE